MNRTAFKLLLKKYSDGTANADETALIDSWYELLYNESLPPIAARELESIEEEMWSKIVSKGNIAAVTHHQIAVKTPLRKIIFRWSAAAAVITMISLGGFWLYSDKSSSSIAFEKNSNTAASEEIVNTTKEPLKIKLEDGSYVVLQPDSKIAFPKHFAADKREVFMEGEAFFKVAKNPARPFFVYNQNLVTQVLGTSFTVKADKNNKQVIVEVKSGKVTVFENGKQLNLNNSQQKNNGAIITPNQKCVYNTKDRYFVTALSENPEPIITEDTLLHKPFNFLCEDVKLSDILTTLETAYAIEIVTENENINGCRFTGDLSALTLYDKLELICLSTNHTYEIKGTKILIKGKGCNE